MPPVEVQANSEIHELQQKLEELTRKVQELATGYQSHTHKFSYQKPHAQTNYGGAYPQHQHGVNTYSAQSSTSKPVALVVKHAMEEPKKDVQLDPRVTTY